MYVLSGQIVGLPVLSLQSGGIIAIVDGLVMDPASFEVVALRCGHLKDFEQAVITPSDVRQVAQDGIIVDSEEALTEAGDIVRLGPTLELAPFPIGAHVVTDLGRKLGKVEDFTLDLDTLKLQKLHVKPSIVQSLLSGELIIDQSQILDVKPPIITVRDVAVKSPMTAAGTVPEV